MTLVGHNVRVDFDTSRERVAEDLSGLMVGVAEAGRGSDQSPRPSQMGRELNT